MREAGNTSIHALLFLIFLAALFVGAAVYISRSISYGERTYERFEKKKELRDKADEVILLFGNDNTPENDTFIEYNLMLDSIEEVKEGFEITLEDISSRLNPNWTRQSVFETGLKRLFKAGVTAKDFYNFQGQTDFTHDLSVYEDIFDFENNELLDYITTYSYANISTTALEELRELFALKTDNEAEADAFYYKLLDIEGKKFINSTELNNYLGSSYDKLFPLINAEPAMNIFFVQEDIFKELISIKYGQQDYIKNHTQISENVISERENQSWTLDEFKAKIPTQKAPQKRIYEYFGVVTWFWRIVIEKENRGLEIILARIPSDNKGSGSGASASSSDRVYKIIEERYYYLN